MADQKGIKGQLSSLPLTDLMQWIEMNSKTGLLFVTRGSSARCFCFQEGSILFAGSNEDGERLGDYFEKEALLENDKIIQAIEYGRENKVSFLDRLVEEKVVPKKFMKVFLQHVAEAMVVQILTWGDGSFHFIESLPLFVADGEVKLNTNHLVFESVRKYDEEMKNKGTEGA